MFTNTAKAKRAQAIEARLVQIRDEQVARGATRSTPSEGSEVHALIREMEGLGLSDVIAEWRQPLAAAGAGEIRTGATETRDAGGSGSVLLTVRRARQIEARLEAIAAAQAARGGQATPSETREVEQLCAAFDDLGIPARAAQARASAQGLRAGLSSGEYTTESGAGEGDDDPQPRRRTTGSARPSGTRGDALRVLDRMERDGADRAGLATYERLLTDEHDEQVDPEAIAAYLVAGGSDAYVSAFAKAVRAAMRSGSVAMAALEFSEAEREAWERAQTYAARAISLGGGGGILVPVQIDPAIQLTAPAGSEADDIRRVASVRTATGSVYRAVTSAGVNAAFAAELAEAPDGAPTLASVDIALHRAHCWVPYSIEVEQDVHGLAEQLATMFRDARGRLEADKFINGSGTGEPWGIAARLVQAGGKVVATTAIDTLSLTDIYAVRGAVPARWRRDGSWLVSDLAVDAIRRLGEGVSGQAGHLVEGIADGTPDRLLGRPLTQSTALDKPGATVGASNDDVAVYGDLRQYVIAQHPGSIVEPVQTVVGPNGRPIGARGLYYFFREGADLVVPDAARLLRA